MNIALQLALSLLVLTISLSMIGTTPQQPGMTMPRAALRITFWALLALGLITAIWS